MDFTIRWETIVSDLLASIKKQDALKKNEAKSFMASVSSLLDWKDPKEDALNSFMTTITELQMFNKYALMTKMLLQS